MQSTDGGASWTDYNTGFSEVDAAAQEEFLVAGNMLYCTALFDVYSVESTGSGFAEQADPSLSVFPTAFADGFTLRNKTAQGELVLLDVAGRTVRKLRAIPGTDQWIPRNDLPAGTYRAMIQDRVSGTRIDLGAVIAR